MLRQTPDAGRSGFDDNEKAAVRELCYAVAIDPKELGV